MDQARESYESLLLWLGGRVLRSIALLIAGPILAEIRQAALQTFRLEQQPLRVLEVSLEKRPVHLLDERVQADVFLVVLAGNGERELGIGGARRRNAGRAVDGE